MPEYTKYPDLSRQIGLIAAEPTGTLLAVAAQTGLDFIVLDAEQTSLTVHHCTEAVHRLSGSATEVAIRVPDLEERTLVAFANTGAHELVLPRVRTLEELEQAHKATRFVPEGRRSKQVSFASAFGRDYSRVPRLTVLFETVEAVDSIEELVASPFFEGGWVGPADLAGELYRAGRTAPDALEEATQKVVDALLSAGQSVGLPGAGVEGIAASFIRGADRVALYWERHLVDVMAEIVSSRDSVSAAVSNK